MLRTSMVLLASLFFGASATAAGTRMLVSQNREPVLAHDSATHRSEAVLRSVIAEMMAGAPDFSRMDPALQTAVRAQMPFTSALFPKLGALRSIDYMETINNADVYRVEFEKAPTIWSIRIDENGRIAGLRFQPAFPK